MQELQFEIHCHGERIRGLMWRDDGHPSKPRPLVVSGHGLTMSKRSLFPTTLATDLVARGFIVAAIDAPAHGERTPADARDPASVAHAWRRHWRAHGADRVAAETGAALDVLTNRPEVDSERVGWWGLSLATQYGLGVLAAEPRFKCAVLGLFGLPDFAPRMAAYAPRVTCPILFIRQLDDDVHSAERSQALYDLIASTDKTLVSSPGGHVDVPPSAFERAYDFLLKRLS